MIMGLGQALLEDGVFDKATGRVVSASRLSGRGEC